MTPLPGSAPAPNPLPDPRRRSNRLVVWGLSVVGFVAVATGAAYLVNPANVPSPDPRGRLAGYIPYTLASESMAPRYPGGTRVLTCTWAYVGDEPARGDVIAFRPPHTPVTLAKRTVGLPGEILRFSGGVLTVDGIAIDEPYLFPGDVAGADFEAVVPDGHVFVAGDYRSRSMDSRHFGPVASSSIIGKVCGRL
jgi:signal peptidase I